MYIIEANDTQHAYDIKIVARDDEFLSLTVPKPLVSVNHMHAPSRNHHLHNQDAN